MEMWIYTKELRTPEMVTLWVDKKFFFLNQISFKDNKLFNAEITEMGFGFVTCRSRIHGNNSLQAGRGEIEVL